jgi:hypothetical protein
MGINMGQKKKGKAMKPSLSSMLSKLAGSGDTLGAVTRNDLRSEVASGRLGSVESRERVLAYTRVAIDSEIRTTALESNGQGLGRTIIRNTSK